MKALPSPEPKAVLLSYDEALLALLRGAESAGTEQVALACAAGRVLAAPLAALISSPRCDVSAMDGYAVADADLGAAPVRLRVWGESFPGKPTRCGAGGGRAVRVFTGAPMPAGADRVVVQEDVVRTGTTAVFPPVGAGKRHVRREGSDFIAGEVLIAANTLLAPRHLLVAAAADHAEFTVVRRPRVAIIATGDELVRPGGAARTAEALPDSISAAVAALVAAWGGDSVALAIVGDDTAAIADAAQNVDADVIVLCGGASVGDRDSSRAALAAAGLQPMFAGVSVKPGKPVWAGTLGGRRVLGLPGNPVAAFTVARLLLAPLVASLGGRRAADALSWEPQVSIGDLPPTGDRETFLLAQGSEGSVRVSERQDASAQIVLARADALARRPAFSAALKSGTVVPVMRL